MKQTISLCLLSLSCSAFGQGIDVNMVDAAPQAMTSGPAWGAINQTNVYNPASAASAAAGAEVTPAPPGKRSIPFGRRSGLASMDKRDVAACSPAPPGTGPLANPNTLQRFLGSTQFDQLAKSVPIAPGYMPSFVNLKSATQQNS